MPRGRALRWHRPYPSCQFPCAPDRARAGGGLESSAAESYGVLAVAVRDQRRDAMDRLIAAHALSLGLTLVTNNEADF